jgi:hypothetical protein
VDGGREIVSGLTTEEARRCLDRLVSAVYPSGVRNEVSVILLRIEETSERGAHEVLLENLEAGIGRGGLPRHAAVPDLLLECWAELEKLRSLQRFALRLEHDGRARWQRMQEMDELVLPITNKADRAAELLFAGFHENQQPDPEEARRHADEPTQRALDFLAALGLNVSLAPFANMEQDESLLPENRPTVTEDDVQFVRRLSQSLVAGLDPDGRGDAETVQAVRQRVVEWQERKGRTTRTGGLFGPGGF